MIESSAYLDQLTWRQPWWLLLLVIPLGMMVVRQLHPRNHRHQKRLAQFIDPRLWHWLLTRPDNPQHNAMPWLLLLAWGLIALAASGPHFSDSSATAIARSIDIAVIVDISPSMAADDIAPTRLERAKLELRDFTARLKADRTALIAYSANAYKVLPLTPDRNTLHHFSAALDITLTRKRGSNLTQALERAMQLLDHSAKQGRAIVLLTDGESHHPQADLNVAKRLHKKQIPLLILGIGTREGGLVTNEHGKRLHHKGKAVISRLDANTLQRLATASGGTYTSVSNDDHDWDKIFHELDRLEPLNRYRAPYQPQQFQLFPWLMGAAIMLFIITGMRQQRHGITLLVLPLLLFLPSPSTEAASLFKQWSESQAYQALNEGRYAEAAYRYSEIKSYRGQLGYGVAAYRQQEWQVAADAFAHALQFATNEQQRAQAHYNHGNALSQLRKLDDAVAAYESALQYQSNFPRAALNLSLINEARAQQGGVQKRAPQKQQQATSNATHASDAELSAAQLNTHDQQSDVRNLKNKTEPQVHKPFLPQPHQTNRNEQQQGLPLERSGDDETVNWNNALQQAQAIDQRLGYQFMRQRFMTQEEEMAIEVKAEEKPW